MKQQGFMLIDIMVAIAIIGILAALIVPSYQQQVLSSYRLEASTELLRLAGLQANMQAEHGRFSHDFRELGLADADGLTQSGRYKLQVLLTAEGFQLLANAIGPQTQDHDCLRLTLDHTGVKTSEPSNHCWSQ